MSVFKPPPEPWTCSNIMTPLPELKKILSFATMAIGWPRPRKLFRNNFHELWKRVSASKLLLYQVIFGSWNRTCSKIKNSVRAPSERGHLPSQKPIDLSSGDRCQLVSFFNSLLHNHEEIVKIQVSGAKFYTVEYSEQLSGHAAAPAAQILPVSNNDPENVLSTEVDANSVYLALGVR